MATENSYCNGEMNGFANGQSDDVNCFMTDYNAKLQSDKATKTVMERIHTVVKPGITKEEVVKQYADWVENSDYEQVVTGVGAYVGHELAVQHFTKHFPAEKRSEAKILDVGAGTGMVARGLRQQGFRYIDALDPSEAMLSVARKDHLYDQYILEYLTDKELPIPADSYDGVTAAACFSANHVPCAALHELIRLVKPGGLITIVTRLDYLSTVPEYIGRLEPLMDELEKKGKWEIVARVTGPRFYLDKESVIWTYRVLEQSSPSQ